MSVPEQIPPLSSRIATANLLALSSDPPWIAPRVVDVVSGVLSRSADDGVDCIESVYARTDAAKKLLVDGATEAAKAGGYPLPGWAKPASTQPDPEPGPTTNEEETPAGEAKPEPETAAAPQTTTTTTEGGCSAAPRKTPEIWPFGLVVGLSFIKRRRRSHSPV